MANADGTLPKLIGIPTKSRPPILAPADDHIFSRCQAPTTRLARLNDADAIIETPSPKHLRLQHTRSDRRPDRAHKTRFRSKSDHSIRRTAQLHDPGESMNITRRTFAQSLPLARLASLAGTDATQTVHRPQSLWSPKRVPERLLFARSLSPLQSHRGLRPSAS